MASHRLSDTYRQSKREGGSALHSSKQKSTKATALGRPQENSVEPETALGQAQRLLRQFDLTAKFGPCTNITRRQRWERANKLGLDPPESVLHALEQLETSHPEQQGIWADRT